MNDTAGFTVLGIPVTQGSMRKGNRGQIIHANPKKLEEWRESVGWNARRALPRQWSKAGAFCLDITFFLPRPRSVAQTITLPIAHKNDLDKLVRAILDSLKAIAYDDDGQVTDLHLRKRFGPAHAEIVINHVMG